MAKPDDSRRKKIMVLASTAAVTLVFVVIVLFAAFSPPPPEGVVSGMLESFAAGDANRLKTYIAGSAEESLLAAIESQENSRWRTFWDDGQELFREFRVGEVLVRGNQAVVTVYYGPGLILEEEFVLYRTKGSWKVYEFNNEQE